MELVHASISEFIAYGGEPPELKHLVGRGREIKRDFVSSGERTRKRLNQEKKFFWGYGLRYVSEDLAEWYGKANQRM